MMTITTSMTTITCLNRNRNERHRRQHHNKAVIYYDNNNYRYNNDNDLDNNNNNNNNNQSKRKNHNNLHNKNLIYVIPNQIQFQQPIMTITTITIAPQHYHLSHLKIENRNESKVHQSYHKITLLFNNLELCFVYSSFCNTSNASITWISSSRHRYFFYNLSFSEFFSFFNKCQLLFFLSPFYFCCRYTTS
jgi:hypothetical protein